MNWIGTWGQRTRAPRAWKQVANYLEASKEVEKLTGFRDIYSLRDIWNAYEDVKEK